MIFRHKHNNRYTLICRMLAIRLAVCLVLLPVFCVMNSNVILAVEPVSTAGMDTGALAVRAARENLFGDEEPSMDTLDAFSRVFTKSSSPSDLPSRMFYQDELLEAVKRSHQPGVGQVMTGFIKFQNFKAINDIEIEVNGVMKKVGHAIGDEVIRAGDIIASKLQEAVPPGVRVRVYNAGPAYFIIFENVTDSDSLREKLEEFILESDLGEEIINAAYLSAKERNAVQRAIHGIGDFEIAPAHEKVKEALNEVTGSNDEQLFDDHLDMSVSFYMGLSQLGDQAKDVIQVAVELDHQAAFAAKKAQLAEVVAECQVVKLTEKDRPILMPHALATAKPFYFNSLVENAKKATQSTFAQYDDYCEQIDQALNNSQSDNITADALRGEFTRFYTSLAQYYRSNGSSLPQHLNEYRQALGTDAEGKIKEQIYQKALIAHRHSASSKFVFLGNSHYKELINFIINDYRGNGLLNRRLQVVFRLGVGSDEFGALYWDPETGNLRIYRFDVNNLGKYQTDDGDKVCQLIMESALSVDNLLGLNEELRSSSRTMVLSQEYSFPPSVSIGFVDIDVANVSGAYPARRNFSVLQGRADTASEQHKIAYKAWISSGYQGREPQPQAGTPFKYSRDTELEKVLKTLPEIDDLAEAVVHENVSRWVIANTPEIEQTKIPRYAIGGALAGLAALPLVWKIAIVGVAIAGIAVFYTILMQRNIKSGRRVDQARNNIRVALCASGLGCLMFVIPGITAVFGAAAGLFSRPALPPVDAKRAPVTDDVNRFVGEKPPEPRPEPRTLEERQAVRHQAERLANVKKAADEAARKEIEDEAIEAAEDLAEILAGFATDSDRQRIYNLFGTSDVEEIAQACYDDDKIFDLVTRRINDHVEVDGHKVEEGFLQKAIAKTDIPWYIFVALLLTETWNFEVDEVYESSGAIGLTQQCNDDSTLEGLFNQAKGWGLIDSTLNYDRSLVADPQINLAMGLAELDSIDHNKNGFGSLVVSGRLAAIEKAHGRSEVIKFILAAYNWSAPSLEGLLDRLEEQGYDWTKFSVVIQFIPDETARTVPREYDYLGYFLDELAERTEELEKIAGEARRSFMANQGLMEPTAPQASPATSP